MISVVIPLYNKATFVEKAVRSVISQTYPHFELLVVDDGSTDNSAMLVDNFRDVRITYIKKDHSGVSATRNRGIQEATSDYIALLDADDWWAPTYLEEIAEAINKFPTNKLFATGRIHVFTEKEVMYKNSYLPRKGETGLVNHFQVISKHLPALHSSNITFLKDYFLQNGGFNENMQHFEDHECWLRLALEQPIVFINKPLSYYNKTNQGSLSHTLVTCSDLHHYFKTIILIKERLSGKQRRFFNKFYRRFVKWSYLKYAPSYTEKERIILQKPLHQLFSILEVKILHILQNIGIANIYQNLKRNEKW